MNSAAPATTLHHSTQLALTPQLQQSLRLLQMSALELEAEVSHMLDTNPFLELDEAQSDSDNHNDYDTHSDGDTNDHEHSDDTDLTPTPPQRDEIPSTDSALLEHFTHTLAQASAGHEHEHGPPLEIADHPPDTSPSADSTTGAAPQADSDTLANLNPAPQSLAEHLHAQARLLRLSELDAAALHHLIDNLDERGYLNDSLDDLIAHLLRQPHSNNDGDSDHSDSDSDAPHNIDGHNDPGDDDNDTPITTLRHHFRLALQLLHTLEPAGVGARDLAECLRLQLLPLLQHQPNPPAPTNTPGATAAHTRTIATIANAARADQPNIRTHTPAPPANPTQPNPTPAATNTPEAVAPTLTHPHDGPLPHIAPLGAAAHPPAPSAPGAAVCHAHCAPAQPGPIAQPDAAPQHHGNAHAPRPPSSPPSSNAQPHNNAMPTPGAAAPSATPSASASATPLSDPAAIALQLCQPATLAALGRRNPQQQIRFVEQTLTPPPAPAHIAAALALLARLEPNPGRPFAHSDTTAIVPDLIVSATTPALPASATSAAGQRTNLPRAAAQWSVRINPDTVPALRIHALYARALRQHTSGHEALHQRLQEARWFVRNVQQRFDTLLRVAQAIVQRQRGFLTHGDVALRPLLLRDIAQDLGLHESTISRVTTAKYIATPRGVYELKHFFSTGLTTDNGTEAASTAVRALLRQLIAAEDPHAPLSDSALADCLLTQGITCARRTVAKYREELRIPPASQRQIQKPT